MSSPTPPPSYVPEFCHSSIERITLLLSDINDKIFEFKGLVAKNDINIKIKIDELEKLYHEVDREMYKIKSISNLVADQSNMNITFSGKFESIEKRIKIILSIVFLGISGSLTFLFFFIKMWGA